MTVFIVIIIVFFAIVSLLFLLGWHSHRESNMLGGIVLMIIALAIFFIVLFLASRGRQKQTQTGSIFLKNYSVSERLVIS